MKKILTVILVTLTLLVTNIIPAKAATGTVSATLSSSSIAVGNKVKVTIKLKCSTGVGGAIIYISTDNNYISSITMAASKYGTFDNNRILVNGTDASTITFTLTLTTIKVGKTNIQLVVSDFIDYDFNDIIGYTENFKLSLSIVKATSTNTETKTLSQDATIATLTTGALQLDQQFDPSNLEYIIYAPKGTEKAELVATPSSAKAKITAFDSSLKEGWNKINIECVAENGNKQTYIINVYVEETPTIFFDLDVQKLGVVKNLDKIEPIEGFQAEEYDYKEEKITLFNHTNLDLIYLVNEKDEKDYYVFDRQTNTVKSIYQPIVVDGKPYLTTVFNYEDFPELEKDFIRDTIIIEGRQLNCWKYIAENMKDYALVYLKDENGNNRLFSYDSKTETLQRYTLPIVEDNTQLQLTIAYSVAIAGFVSFIISLIFVGKNKKRNS